MPKTPLTPTVRPRSLFPTACWLVLGALTAAPGNAQSPITAPTGTRVVTDKVRLENVPRYQEVPGELRVAKRSTVAARQAGLMVQVNVEPGDRIEAGKVLAKLDDRFARLEVSKAEARVAAHRASLSERQAGVDKAKRQTQRYEAAFAAAGVTESELDEARTSQSEAEARWAQAQAELAAEEADLSVAKERFQDMTIRAPFTGVIAARRAEAGEWLAQGAPVVEVVATEMVDAWLEVPQDLLAMLPSGGSAPVQIRPLSSDTRVDDLVRTVELVTIVPEADSPPRVARVRARLDNPGNGLRPGTRIVGLVPIGETFTALTVDRAGVLSGPAGTRVIINAEGTAVVAPVSIVSAVADRWVVTSSALKEGMDVVITGHAGLVGGERLVLDSPGKAGDAKEAGAPAP